MDCQKIGGLIASLRKEKGLTQLQVANVLGVSDKAVSKWERGLGCPDISLLEELARIFGVEIKTILAGEIDLSQLNGGNMKRIAFYQCSQCGCITANTGNADISCCGRKLEPLAVRPADSDHRPEIQLVEDEYYITFPHEMTKGHYISFCAYVKYDRVLLVKLYPEQDPALRLPMMGKGKLYFYCTQDGLMELPI